MKDGFLLFEYEKQWKFNLPLTYFQPASNILIGILSIREKWENYFNIKSAIVTRPYLMEKFGRRQAASLFIPGHILPNPQLVQALNSLPPGTRLTDTRGQLLGFRTEASHNPANTDEIHDLEKQITDKKIYTKAFKSLHRPYDAVFLNQDEIVRDLQLLALHSAACPQGAVCSGDHKVYLRGKQHIHHAIFDLTEGPVFLDDDVKLLPGTFIKGPAAILTGSMVKAGTRIYNGTTLGPWTKVGGEIKNVLFQGYANKGHDGFLGDSVIGKWSNFGAGSSNSNLKNNYSGIRMWNIARKAWEDTGKIFLGLVMGDHSKCAINTSFNTGTVAGVSSNIFTRDFPPKFISSFNWGGSDFNHQFQLDRALEIARMVYARRNVDFDETEEKIFREVYRLANEIE